MSSIPVSQPSDASPAEPDALVVPPFGLSRVRTGPDADQRVSWWREARFGMFIHFGLYSLPGRGEWVMCNESIPHREYAQLADQFTPDPAAPKAWAATARAAGMKYMVLVARHHDGYSLFDSRANPFNTMRTAARQDVVRTFVDAARAEGLRVGLYYSPLDWRFPGYFFPDLYLESAEAMREQYHREIEQLATDYGPIDLMWYDGGGEEWLGFGGIDRGPDGWKTRDRGKPYAGRFSWQDDVINARLRQLQPGILINDRTSTPGDWRTRENARNLGGYQNREPWELCMTIAGAWGYQPNVTPRSLQDLVRLLTQTAARDGNYLLNVGPAPDGHIAPDQTARLKELGAWLETHGRSIYGTRGGPFQSTDQFASTRRDNLVYLHVLPTARSEAACRLVLPRLRGGPELQSAAVVDGQLPVTTTTLATGETELCWQFPPQDWPSLVLELRYADSVMNAPLCPLQPD
jgi:alpha-L-fucosidase